MKTLVVPRHALPYVLLLGTMFGSSLVVSRFSVGQFDPRTYIAIRMTLAALLHAGVYLMMPGRVWPTNRKLWTHAAILGIIGTAIPMTAVVSSLQYQSSGITSLLLTLNPVVTLLLAALFLEDEKFTLTRGAGVTIALGGAALLLLRGETGLSQFAQADWRGYGWAGVGILASACGSIYARRFLRFGDSFDVASIRMLSAAVILCTVTSLTVGFDLSRVETSGYVALLYASLVGTFLGFILSFYIVKQFGATVSSQTSYVMPVSSTLLGALFLGEQVSLTMLVGMAIIFTGLTLLNWQDVRRMAGYRRRVAISTADD